MSTTGSVSKGCFTFKGKKRRVNVEDYLPRAQNKDIESCQARFHELWEEMDTQMQILQSDFNSSIFEELLTYTQCAHASFSLETCASASLREIPAAALVTGVNTPDHGTMFGNLVSMLRDRVTPLVTILKSKDCQSVRNILTRTMSQLLDNTHLDYDDDEDSEAVNSRPLPLTLSTLAKWYHNKYVSKPSSPKKRKSSAGVGVERGGLPPVVIVMEDFENFPPRVVQDFIIITSNYISLLPVVFIFGIATSVSAIHRLLPNEVSSLLCMEKFQAPPSTEYLALAISQMLMTSRCPFKLGKGVFQLLLDIFLYYDFSVLNFNQALRFAMLDHYTSQPLSYLCCNHDDTEVTVNQMDGQALDRLRQLSSFMSYVEECSTTEQPSLLLDEKFTKRRVVQLINEMFEYHINFFPILNCLHTLVSKLPGYPLGKQVREVYSACLEESVWEREDYKHATDLLRMLAKDELKTLVTQCVNKLATEAQLASVKADLERFGYRMDHIDEEAEEEPAGDMEMVDTSLPSRTSLHQLRQRLQDISKKQKKQSPFEKLREEIVDYCHALFRKYLIAPSSLPLYEIFYYTSTRVIKQRLNASPRSALQKALSNPGYYLQVTICVCCDVEGNHIGSRMPDTCVVYKLHLECGQLINLYDWMQAFVTVVQQEDENDSLKQADHKLQARFIQAVSQLQFLGFIKPTKRKTDHVARLTWGGC
ncbi:origin recognition complex subunit 3-like isoform X1 [Mya arenaria]|uniref:origin recognition complex subunit 3-like isoform X1 n=2 Tax=Mya arenaria TaxID=6604 RepID=UPI0022E5218B|nr:origin recognition complex subunit 3-like isoform X1 [Mya arenaria]